MSDAVTDEEQEGSGDGAASPGDGHDEEVRSRKDGWRPSVAAVAAVAFAALAIFLAVVASSLQSRLDERGDERDEVRRVAGAFTESVLSYAYDDLDTNLERVLGLSTGSFATQYEAAFPGLRELITVGRTRTVATVKEVYVADVERGRARAITVTDVSGDGEGGPRSQLNSYILLDLVRTEDGWRVDGVTDLAFDIATVLGGEDGPATSLPTSTTAPQADGG